jgi:hypothetical protein
MPHQTPDTQIPHEVLLDEPGSLTRLAANCRRASLSVDTQPDFWTAVPLFANMQQLHDRRSEAIRLDSRDRQGRATNLSLSPMAPRRLRSAVKKAQGLQPLDLHLHGMINRR